MNFETSRFIKNKVKAINVLLNFFIQEVDIFPEETKEDHVLTAQAPVKMGPTLSFDNEACTPDWTSLADDIAEERQLYMFFNVFLSLINTPSRNKSAIGVGN